MSDRELARRIRGELPPEAFCTNPMRLLIAAPLLAAILGLSWRCVRCRCLPQCQSHSFSAISMSACFSSAMRWGTAQYLRAVQTLVTYFSFAIFFLATSVWITS
jgi:hypothetical protein